VHSASVLTHFPRPSDPQTGAVYLQLPAGEDIERVASLTSGIIAGRDNRYDQVRAIEKYLKQNYTYDLGVPPQEREGDAVSYFLFDEKRGYCEHFASAMAVMARSAGIPARVVTGYGGGEYNPFTGLWEIRESDAHAWVEIYFGTAGWVPFDPTPGFDVPGGQPQGQGNWLAGRIFSYLGDTLGSGPVGGALGYLGSGIRATVSLAVDLPLALILAIAAALAVLGWTVRKAGARGLAAWRLRRQVAGSLGLEYRHDDVLREYYLLSLRLGRRGLRRRREETLRAFAARVTTSVEAAEFATLSEMVERMRYEEVSLPAESALRARELAGRVLARLETRDARRPGPATGLS
jgi:transglutaminase-like putative cysteine protease